MAFRISELAFPLGEVELKSFWKDLWNKKIHNKNLKMKFRKVSAFRESGWRLGNRNRFTFPGWNSNSGWRQIYVYWVGRRESKYFRSLTRISNSIGDCSLLVKAMGEGGALFHYKPPKFLPYTYICTVVDKHTTFKNVTLIYL